MDIHGFQTTGLNITDPHHADTIIGEASTSEENTSDPYTTYEHWKQLRSPYPDSPLHDYTAPQWPKRTTSLALEDELETEILFPSGQIEFLDGYQTRYGPAISGVEHSSQVYQDSLGPFIFYEDKSWPPKGSGPLSKVCPREPVLTYRDELASSPDSNPATIGPGQDPDAVGRKGSSSLLESPWPSSEEESLKPPEHVPKQCGISSQAAAETTFSLDVGLEGVTWHRHSPTPPGRNFPVYSLSPEVKPIGSAGPMDISSDKHLVEAQTEHRPSHAYPRRQGTGRSQLAMNITSASELGIEESSEPISGGGLPASRTDKPNIEASADAFFLQAEAERLQSARIEQVQGSNLNHSFTYLGNSLATSASSSPFTPMDLVPVHAWSLDPKPGPAVKIKDLDDPEIQCMEWVNFNDGFDSSL
ncbi:MAG: hypothetical protein M1830_000168 [Pleopsidium flavum]|nr:MAG: hypothetical protein M1830_000168 [Pleopsidium flavum]